MSDNTIFDNANNSSSGDRPPAQDSNQKITTQDLYGPSGSSMATPQSGEQNVQQAQIDSQSDSSQVAFQEPSETNEQQAVFYQANPPLNTRMSLLLGNKKLLIGIAVGGFLILIIIFGLISRIRSGGRGNGASNATLTYWGLWEEDKTMDTIINDFEKKNPGIKINYEKQDPEKYKERLVTRIENDTQAPDVFTFHNTWLPSLTNSSDNILLPLSTEAVNADDFQKNYYPVVQKDLIKNGAIYGIPQGIDTLSLFINKEIFEAAGLKIPTTWEEFNSTAKSLTVKDSDGKIKTAGVALGTYDNITHAPDVVSLLLVANGLNLESIDKQEDLLKQTMRHYTSFTSTPESVWNNTLSPSRDMFIGGNLAMYFGYSWDIFVINSMNKELKFEIHPVPYLPSEGGRQNRVTIASYWANGISAKSKNQKEAFLFIKYLGEKETLQKIYTEASKTRLFGMPYARKDLASTLSKNGIVYPFVKQAEYSTSSYFSSDTHDSLYNGPLNDYLGNAIRQIISSGGSVDSAVKTFIQGVNQVRSQAQK